MPSHFHLPRYSMTCSTSGGVKSVVPNTIVSLNLKCSPEYESEMVHSLIKVVDRHVIHPTYSGYQNPVKMSLCFWGVGLMGDGILLNTGDKVPEDIQPRLPER